MVIIYNTIIPDIVVTRYQQRSLLYFRIEVMYLNQETFGKVLYKIPEVVQATGYSRSFVYQAIGEGSLKVVRKGRTIRVTAEDLQAWINNDAS